MLSIRREAKAGFAEKQDILITVFPKQSGIEIELESKVQTQYRAHIEALIRQTIVEAGFDGVRVVAQDQGAWDYTIKARVLAALNRAKSLSDEYGDDIEGAIKDEIEGTIQREIQSEIECARDNSNHVLSEEIKSPSDNSSNVLVETEKSSAVNSENALTETAKERLARSMMFVPGNTPKMLNSADVYGADSLMFDIEDSIFVDEKDSARLLVAEMLKAIPFRSETVVRINHPTQTPFGLDDLDVIVRAKPNLIRLPKTEDVSEVELVAHKIAEVEQEMGWPEGAINIIVAIESVKGLYNVREICHGPRVVGIALGAEDYRADLRTGKSKPAVELTLARQTILLAAREAGIRCIDTVFSDVKDTEGFLEEVNYIKSLGFDGKSCIHPTQVALAHKVFTPSDKEIAYSVKVLNAYADAVAHNKGVLAVDGKMIDKPIVVRAQRIIDKARAAGIKVQLASDTNGSIEASEACVQHISKKGKVLASLEEAIEKTGLADGMTISFHHHFRNGDYVMRLVMEAIKARGIKDLTIAASSLSPCHEFLIDYIKAGIVTALETSGVRDELGKYVTYNPKALKRPLVVRSHGGRARAIVSGELHIDVAFMGAPTCDYRGNFTGSTGKSACGSLGYAMVDSHYADTTVAITDNLVDVVPHPSVPQTDVDYVVVVDEIGDAEGIASGAIGFAKSPVQQKIAELAGQFLNEANIIKEGFAFQLGAGGASLTVAKHIGDSLRAKGLTAGFGIGGATGILTGLLEEGLIKAIYDTQSFDTVAAHSLATNPNHIEISASMYANPWTDCMTNYLDVVFLGATEIDVNFNVNCLTDSNGVLMGASGGHSDTAEGAKCTVITCPLTRGRLPMIVDQVQTVITPGSSVDVLVTERGIAINPARIDLIEQLKNSNLPIYTIQELQRLAHDLVGVPETVKVSQDEGDVVAVVEERRGGIGDKVRKPLR
ncbi:MAG: citrate lyase subunit alpha [Veillonella caviae]|nr:citrate lyase subunit alpha [Veillonella caviae]